MSRIRRRPHDASLYHLPFALLARREDLGALHGQPGGGHEHAPAAPLTLASTEDLGKSALWLRYNVEGA